MDELFPTCESSTVRGSKKERKRKRKRKRERESSHTHTRECVREKAGGGGRKITGGG